VSHIFVELDSVGPRPPARSLPSGRCRATAKSSPDDREGDPVEANILLPQKDADTRAQTPAGRMKVLVSLGEIAESAKEGLAGSRGRRCYAGCPSIIDADALRWSVAEGRHIAERAGGAARQRGRFVTCGLAADRVRSAAGACRRLLRRGALPSYELFSSSQLGDRMAVEAVLLCCPPPLRPRVWSRSVELVERSGLDGRSAVSPGSCGDERPWPS